VAAISIARLNRFDVDIIFVAASVEQEVLVKIEKPPLTHNQDVVAKKYFR